MTGKRRILTAIILLILCGLAISGCSSQASCPPTCIGANLMNKGWERKNLHDADFAKANLSRANLANADLSGADLRGADLNGATLDGAKLNDASMVGANLENASLVNVDLQNADLSGAWMANANLTRANMDGIKMDGCDLSEAKLTGADLIGVRISGCSMAGVNLRGADLTHSVLSGNDLSEADLSGAVLNAADLSGSNLTKATMIGARMNQIKLTGATLTNAVLDGADMRLADLQGALFIGTSIKGASLDRANLAGASLAGANLQGSVMSEANLSMARFSDVVQTENGPVFQAARLGGASLNRADLSYAYLVGVSFRGTSLLWAKLGNAIIKETVQIGGESLEKQVDWIGAIREPSEQVPYAALKPTPIPFAPTPSPTPLPTPTQIPPEIRDTLTIGTQEGVFTLNPFAPLTVTAGYALDQVYETLFELQPDGAYHPLLAQNVVVSPDGKTFTITMAGEVRFHDGAALTAQDAAYSINLYREYWGLQSIQKAEALDDLTLVITFTEPVQDIGYRLGQLYILPKHIWEPLAAQQTSLKDIENNQPVGSGPFKVVEFTKGEAVHFTANPDHWRNPPKIKGMLWRYFAKQDDLLQALITGQLVMIHDVPVYSINALKSNPAIQVVSGPPVKPSLRDVIFNQVDTGNCPAGAKCSGHPALKDVRLRQALAMATDKQRIIEITMRNMATPGFTLVADQLTPWFNPNLQDYPFDVAAANAILDQAGYLDTDSDGVRDMAGQALPLEFRLDYPSGYPSYMYQRLAEILNENWSALGVRLTTQEIEEDALHAKITTDFDFDIALWGWGGIQPDPSNLLSVLTTRAISVGRSETGYADAEYDALFDAQRKEMDGAKRQEMIWQMQEILMRDVPYIIPYYEQAAYAYRRDPFGNWPLAQEKVMPLYSGNLASLVPVQ